MRISSVFEINHNKAATRSLPKEGTTLRNIYDFLYEERGKPVEISGSRKFLNYRSAALEQLRIFYGCDIVRVKKNTYSLTGEWIGDFYADYKLPK